MRQRLLLAQAVAFVLALAAPAFAQPLALTGFETAIGAIDCPGSFTSGSCGSAGTCTYFGTTSPKSGTYDLVINHGTSTTEGTCQVFPAGLNRTGTMILTGSFKHVLNGGIVCGPTQSDGMVLEVRDNASTVVASLRFKCTSGASDYEIGVFAGATLVGSRVAIPVNTQKQYEIKITTGAGSGVVGARIDGVSVGSDVTGLTIANVDSVFASHSAASGVSTQEQHHDDIVLLDLSTYPGPTVVNMRKPDGAGSGRDNWVKQNGGSITAEWTMPQATTLPASGAKTTYACSGASCSAHTTDNDGQSVTLAAWDSGTPTPVIDSGTMTAIHGCRSDFWAERSGGTNRTYGIYNAQGGTKNTPLAVTLTNGTLELFRQLFAISPATVSNLNSMEIGAEKTSDTSGAAMIVEDAWVQCAWSTVAATTGILTWSQDQ